VCSASDWAPGGEAQFRLPMKLEELERRVHADSNDPAAHFNVALAYWNAKRWQDADKSLRTAILLDPRFAPAYVALNYLPYAQRPSLWNEVRENRVAERVEGAHGGVGPVRPPRLHDRPFVELRSGDVVQPRLVGGSRGAGDVLRRVRPRLLRRWISYFRRDTRMPTTASHGSSILSTAIAIPSAFPTTCSGARLASAGQKWPDAIADFGQLVDRSLEPTKRDSLGIFRCAPTSSATSSRTSSTLGR